MNTKEAWALVGGLSKPSKMPGWSIGIPAKECKTGSKLRLIPKSVCAECYALKGCYVFQVVQAAQYRRLEAISNPAWVQAMTTLINSKKPDVFRWHKTKLTSIKFSKCVELHQLNGTGCRPVKHGSRTIWPAARIT